MNWFEGKAKAKKCAREYELRTQKAQQEAQEQNEEVDSALKEARELLDDFAREVDRALRLRRRHP